jgi:hypothetical protein
MLFCRLVRYAKRPIMSQPFARTAILGGVWKQGGGFLFKALVLWYRQNYPDRSNLRILTFADNKDLHGGGFSESLASVPVIDGTQLETKIKPLLPTHSSNNVCLCTLDFKPRLAIRLFFARPIILLFLPLVITFLPPLSFSLLHDVKRTNERANGRTNGNSPLLTSCSSFAYYY